MPLVLMQVSKLLYSMCVRSPCRFCVILFVRAMQKYTHSLILDNRMSPQSAKRLDIYRLPAFGLSLSVELRGYEFHELESTSFTCNV